MGNFPSDHNEQTIDQKEIISEQNIKNIFNKYDMDMHITNLNVYRQAFMNISYIVNPIRSNERLEHYGNSVVNTVITEYLLDIYPDKNPTFLTTVKCKIICKKNMVMFAKELDFERFVNIPMKKNTSSRLKYEIYADSALESVFGAFIGALATDAGKDVCKQLLVRLIEDNVDLDEL